MRADPRNQFGREAEKYLTSAIHADSEALASLIELVRPNGGFVADIGTGAGHMAFALAPFVERVTAVDPTQRMLDVTAKEARRRGLGNIETQLAHGEKMPFRDGELDGVSTRIAAHHFDDVEAFLCEVERVLKPSGWFLLVDSVSPEDDEADPALNVIERIRDPSHNRNLRTSEWCRLVRKHGLDVEAVSSRFKRLDIQDWMDRMSVSKAHQKWLRELIVHSSGSLREYLQPTDDSFCLMEATILARKRTDPA